ncbi:hypothetical protein HanPI659440_Chr03g0121661 [Helianthus annuus]|nr:hypothetical protein HanPI659440_Chr03g0121661 [Helianthus annuus]
MADDGGTFVRRDFTVLTMLTPADGGGAVWAPLFGSNTVRVLVHSVQIRIWFWFWGIFWFGSNPVDSVNTRVNSGQQQVNSSRSGYGSGLKIGLMFELTRPGSTQLSWVNSVQPSRLSQTRVDSVNRSKWSTEWFKFATLFGVRVKVWFNSV